MSKKIKFKPEETFTDFEDDPLEDKSPWGKKSEYFYDSYDTYDLYSYYHIRNLPNGRITYTTYYNNNTNNNTNL